MIYRLIYSTLILLFLSSCHNSFFKNDLSPILGVEKVEVENNQKLEEWAGVQGDGFVLEVYELSERTVQAFKKNSTKNLPDKIEESKTWQKYNWNETPINNDYNEFLLCV